MHISEIILIYKDKSASALSLNIIMQRKLVKLIKLCGWQTHVYNTLLTMKYNFFCWSWSSSLSDLPKQTGRVGLGWSNIWLLMSGRQTSSIFVPLSIFYLSDGSRHRFETYQHLFVWKFNAFLLTASLLFGRAVLLSEKSTFPIFFAALQLFVSSHSRRNSILFSQLGSPVSCRSRLN